MFNLTQIITYASLGGIIPCLFWLIFWLREDSAKPEPVRMILACFVAGMITTIIVFPFEYFVTLLVKSDSSIAVVLWAVIEESFKLIACYLIALRSKYYDEPIDAVIYMVVIALGFAALENTFFLIGPLSAGNTLDSVITGNLRFIGSSLLHTLASGTIGVFIAFGFYKIIKEKEKFLAVGLLCAIILHTLFNFFILQENGDHTFLVFGSVWVLLVAFIVVLEKIKGITRNKAVI